MVLSTDPGLNHIGVALWSDEGMLLRAWLARAPAKTKKADIATRWRTVAKMVGSGAVDTVVIEGQQVYRARRGADPNDLLELAAVNGALAMLFPDAKMVRYLPRTWTRGAKHDVIVECLKLRLTPLEKTRIERDPPSLAHNVEDAVALGMYHFGRLWR